MKALIRKSGMVVTLVLVVSYGVVALRGPNGIGALAEKRRQIRDLQEQNAHWMRRTSGSASASSC